ncbi:MAG: sugar transferase [Pseudomonadota bacterium]|nr:sugar transferase [Pseudomonadota bacterium]MEC8292041.1 sugar transferase [Pseudomonadota bacterium]
MSFVDLKNEPAELPSNQRFLAGAEARRTALAGGFYTHYGKRLLDITLVLLAAPAVLAVAVVIAVLVSLDGSAPIFRQLRVGRHGRLFRMWKFRSMVPEAEVMLRAHLVKYPAAAAEWHHYQKLKQDPRITRVGAVLRRTSLDELPQLWNVLKGEMSLVGPRPMLPDQQALYPGQAYYSLRPGLTGPWQVSDRNACGFADRAGFDSRYVAEMSLGTDLRLIGATLPVVAKASGH